MTDNENTKRRIEALNRVRPLDQLDKRPVAGSFPEVSDQEYAAAVDGFFALAEKYQIAVDDLPRLLKAYGLMFYRELSALGVLRHPLPAVAVCAGKTIESVATSLSSRMELQLEAYEKLPRFEEFSTFPAVVTWYAVSDQEFKAYRATYQRILEHFGVPERLRQVLRACMTNMLFWIFSPLAKPYDPEDEDSNTKLRWQ